MAELVYKEQKLTDEEIRSFEKLFYRNLPESFKEHYKNNNGGFPAEEDVDAGEWGLPVNGFNPIKYGKLTIEQLIEDYGDLVLDNGAPETWSKYYYVPLAYDGGGNSIFISLKDSDYGCIYIFTLDGNNFQKISNSFEDFLSRLYSKRKG